MARLAPEPEGDYLFGTDVVAPRPVYSEKELAKAFEELLATLSNKDHDLWQRRVEALRSIRAFLLGGAAEYGCFMQCLHSLKMPFADALADLRSTLVREACVTVALLSQHLGNAFAHMAETLIPAILKQIPVTIQVISEASNLSLRALFRHTHSGRLLPLILPWAVSKKISPAVRARCIEYVLIVLELWAWHEIEKHADRIEEVVVQCLADAQPDVRAGARRCVAELCQSYQARGERILRGLDAQTQKKIFEESERGAPRPTRSRSSLRPSSLSATGTSANGGSTSATPTSAGGAGGYLGSKPPSSRGGGSSNGGGGYVGAPGSKMADAKGSHADGDAAQQQQQQAPGGGLGAARRLARSKSLGGAELENLKHSIQTAASEGLLPDKAKAFIKGPKRVLASPAVAEADGEPVMAAERGASGKGEGAGSPRARRAPQRSNSMSGLAGDEEALVSGSGRKGQLSEDELAALVTKCSNSLWSLRESSLLELAAQVELTPPARTLLAQAPRIVEAAAERVADAHYKVQQAALALLSALASHLAACLSPHLDTVLRQIIPRLVDKKEGSRKACIALLNRLYYSCGPQVMVFGTNKAMDGMAGAVKVAVLEYLTADLQRLAPLLAASPSLARALIGHALPLCGGRVLEVRRGACSVAVQLRALAPLALYESLAKPWPPGLLAAVKKALAPYLPHLERELSVFLRTKKLDPQVAAEANSALAAALASKPGTATAHGRHTQGLGGVGSMAGGSDGGRGVGVGEERVAAGERDLEDGDAGTYVAEMYEGSGDEEEEVYSEDALEVKAYSDDDTQQVRCVYCYMKEREREGEGERERRTRHNKHTHVRTERETQTHRRKHTHTHTRARTHTQTHRRTPSSRRRNKKTKMKTMCLPAGELEGWRQCGGGAGWVWANAGRGGVKRDAFLWKSVRGEMYEVCSLSDTERETQTVGLLCWVSRASYLALSVYVYMYMHACMHAYTRYMYGVCMYICICMHVCMHTQDTYMAYAES